LKEFPPVQIVSGGRDPLSDDSLRFVEKFIKNQKQIKMKLYKSLPHGFMNYDYVGGLSPASLAINDSCFMIREFVKSIKEEKAERGK
jgi:acetyl esterase/lipase